MVQKVAGSNSAGPASNCKTVNTALNGYFLNLGRIKVAKEKLDSTFYIPYLGYGETLIPTVFPAGIWCQNDVVSMSMRRNHVASTLIRRHFRTKCPLGYDH